MRPPRKGGRFRLQTDGVPGESQVAEVLDLPGPGP